MAQGIKFKTEAERKEAKRLGRIKYEKTEKGKQKRAIYEKSKEGKQTRVKYEKTEERLEQKRLEYLKIKDTPELWAQRKANLIAWHKENKEHFKLWARTYNKRRASKDPSFKIQMRLRSRVSIALKRQKAKKYYHFDETIGCSPKELKEYIERKFRRGMTWENYSRETWHIDHIIACAKFDLTKEEEQRKCFHYSNLRPLWAKHNLQKGNR